MVAPSLNPPWVALALALVGVALLAWAVRAIAVRRSEARYGTLSAIDAGRPMVMRSERYRLQGRPDAVRRSRDGRLIPIELKTRPSPSAGPAHSHRVQVWAYCLLVEETTGRGPPFGVLRYSDREYQIPWDGDARRELLALRAELDRPYDGRATPSPARCARCPWANVCEARAGRPN